MGWGMNSSNTHTSKLDEYSVLDTVFNGLTKSTDREYVEGLLK